MNFAVPWHRRRSHSPTSFLSFNFLHHTPAALSATASFISTYLCSVSALYPLPSPCLCTAFFIPKRNSFKIEKENFFVYRDIKRNLKSKRIIRKMKRTWMKRPWGISQKGGLFLPHSVDTIAMLYRDLNNILPLYNMLQPRKFYFLFFNQWTANKYSKHNKLSHVNQTHTAI